ncbi:MAG: 1-deoxy-D-xylulose-5-phosphate reductoisomerase [Treponema sp.]|jgi:1-deoxy-D-xylulose-5-phosphate reductoisomerase|nr:1-deoxy-D-xylulose-5-phosphate reductoisomerase [Treponema sp.]
MKKVAILGATGSIGTNTLEVIRHDRDSFDIVLMSAHRNKERLEELGREFPRSQLTLGNELEALADCGADIVVNAIAGSAGLAVSRRSLELAMNLALANKESIVMAAPLLFASAKRNHCAIIPVDSEHSALFRLIQADKPEEIMLTASGGPLWSVPRERLAYITKEDTLQHPTWVMGPKITVDSATMANKGLEVIEASRLFGIALDNITVVIHPQSIVHALIRLSDGSVLAQLAVPDMRLAIQYALYYPQPAQAAVVPQLEWSHLKLNFENPDDERFPLLRLAYCAERSGPLYSVAYNAANEEAVTAFLADRIDFLSIATVVESTLAYDFSGAMEWESIYDSDRRAREYAAVTVNAVQDRRASLFLH